MHAATADAKIQMVYAKVQTMDAKIQTFKGEMHELFTRFQASLGDGKSELGFRKEMHSLRDRFQSVIDGLKEDIGVLKKAVASTPSGAVRV